MEGGHEEGITDILVVSLKLYIDIDINKRLRNVCACVCVCVLCGHLLRQQRTAGSYLR